MTLEFIPYIFEKYQISHYMKIPLLGAELYHAGGRTDGRTDIKLIFAFRNFTEAHKNQPTEILCNSITKKNSFLKYYNNIYYRNTEIHKNCYE